jgi:hypothetical protein
MEQGKKRARPGGPGKRRTLTAADLRPGNCFYDGQEAMIVASTVRDRSGSVVVTAVEARGLSVLRTVYLFEFDPARRVDVREGGVDVKVESRRRTAADVIDGLALAHQGAVSPVAVLRTQERPPEHLRQDATRTTGDDPERAVWYSARCGYWTDDWGKLAKVGPGVPACPSCGCPGMITTAKEWLSNVLAYAKESNQPDYPAAVEAGKEQCSPYVPRPSAEPVKETHDAPAAPEPPPPEAGGEECGP